MSIPQTIILKVMKPVHIQKTQNNRYMLAKPSSAPAGQASFPPTVTVDTPQELMTELQALGFPEQVFNEAMRQLVEGGEAMFFLDTIWATAEEAAGFNIGVTGDSEYAGPIHVANEEDLAGWLAQFIGEKGAVTRAVVATIIHKTSDGQRYETEPTYLWRLNVLRQQRQQPPSQKMVSLQR
jgi:hypothetical protein